MELVRDVFRREGASYQKLTLLLGILSIMPPTELAKPQTRSLLLQGKTVVESYKNVFETKQVSSSGKAATIIEEAISTLDQVKDTEIKGRLCQALVQNLFIRGLYSQALELFSSLPEELVYDTISSSVFRTYDDNNMASLKGKFLPRVRLINDPYTRAKSIAEIAQDIVDKSLKFSLFEEALAIASKIENEERKADCIREIVHRINWTLNPEAFLSKKQTLVLLNKGLEIARNITNETFSLKVIENIGMAMSHNRLFNETSRLIRSIKNKDTKDGLNHNLVRALSNNKSYDEARSIAYSNNDEGMLLEISLLLAEDNFFSRAFEIYSSIKGHGYRGVFLDVLSLKVMHANIPSSQALPVIKKLLKECQKQILNPLEKGKTPFDGSFALGNIVKSYANHKDFKSALKVVDLISDQANKLVCMDYIAICMAKAGADKAEVLEVFNQSLSWAQTAYIDMYVYANNKPAISVVAIDMLKAGLAVEAFKLVNSQEFENESSIGDFLNSFHALLSQDKIVVDKNQMQILLKKTEKIYQDKGDGVHNPLDIMADIYLALGLKARVLRQIL